MNTKYDKCYAGWILHPFNSKYEVQTVDKIRILKEKSPGINPIKYIALFAHNKTQAANNIKVKMIVSNEEGRATKHEYALFDSLEKRWRHGKTVFQTKLGKMMKKNKYKPIL